MDMDHSQITTAVKNIRDRFASAEEARTCYLLLDYIKSTHDLFDLCDEVAQLTSNLAQDPALATDAEFMDVFSVSATSVYDQIPSIEAKETSLFMTLRKLNNKDLSNMATKIKTDFKRSKLTTHEDITNMITSFRASSLAREEPLHESIKHLDDRREEFITRETRFFPEVNLEETTQPRPFPPPPPPSPQIQRQVSTPQDTNRSQASPQFNSKNTSQQQSTSGSSTADEVINKFMDKLQNLTFKNNDNNLLKLKRVSLPIFDNIKNKDITHFFATFEKFTSTDDELIKLQRLDEALVGEPRQVFNHIHDDVRTYDIVKDLLINTYQDPERNINEVAQHLNAIKDAKFSSIQFYLKLSAINQSILLNKISLSDFTAHCAWKNMPQEYRNEFQQKTGKTRPSLYDIINNYMSVRRKVEKETKITSTQNKSNPKFNYGGQNRNFGSNTSQSANRWRPNNNNSSNFRNNKFTKFSKFNKPNTNNNRQQNQANNNTNSGNKNFKKNFNNKNSNASFGKRFNNNRSNNNNNKPKFTPKKANTTQNRNKSPPPRRNQNKTNNNKRSRSASPPSKQAQITTQGYSSDSEQSKKQRKNNSAASDSDYDEARSFTTHKLPNETLPKKSLLKSTRDLKDTYVLQERYGRFCMLRRTMKPRVRWAQPLEEVRTYPKTTFRRRGSHAGLKQPERPRTIHETTIESPYVPPSLMDITFSEEDTRQFGALQSKKRLRRDIIRDLPKTQEDDYEIGKFVPVDRVKRKSKQKTQVVVTDLKDKSTQTDTHCFPEVLNTLNQKKMDKIMEPKGIKRTPQVLPTLTAYVNNNKDKEVTIFRDTGCDYTMINESVAHKYDLEPLSDEMEIKLTGCTGTQVCRGKYYLANLTSLLGQKFEIVAFGTKLNVKTHRAKDINIFDPLDSIGIPIATRAIKYGDFTTPIDVVLGNDFADACPMAIIPFRVGRTQISIALSPHGAMFLGDTDDLLYVAEVLALPQFKGKLVELKRTYDLLPLMMD